MISACKKPVCMALTFFAAGVLLVTMLAGCSPRASADQSAEEGPSDQNAAITVEWSADSDCAVCHVSEQESYENTACMASFHAGQACGSCHVDSLGLSKVHEGKTATDKMPKRLKKTDVADELCLSCHFETRDELAAATAGVAVTDSEGTSVNPHDLPSSDDHDSIHCADCHSMHDTDPIADKAQSQCFSCHHAEVFACGTCHD